MRTCVVLCMLVGFLGGQWAALPHAHPGASNLEFTHHGRPHIHLHLTDCESSHPPSDELHAHQPSDAPSHVRLTHGHDHDADAIYLMGGKTVRLVSSPDPIVDSHFAAQLVEFLPSERLQHLTEPDASCWRPPRPRLSTGPLFLELQTLRI